MGRLANSSNSYLLTKYKKVKPNIWTAPFTASVQVLVPSKCKNNEAVSNLDGWHRTLTFHCLVSWTGAMWSNYSLSIIVCFFPMWSSVSQLLLMIPKVEMLFWISRASFLNNRIRLTSMHYSDPNKLLIGRDPPLSFPSTLLIKRDLVF